MKKQNKKKALDEIFCRDCGEVIKKEAEICPKCGVRQKAQIRSFKKDRISAGVLAILLGSFGVHKFYMEENALGVLYLCFFWTTIPGIVGIIEGILYLVKSDEEFITKYCNHLQ